MKVIDLLNKIANGEDVPKKINICRRNFEYKKDINDYLCTDENFDKTEDYCLGVSICKWIFPSMLNDEIEIIEDTPKEDKKIKRIEERESGWWPNMADGNVSTLKQAINEIIDRLNGEDNE